MKSKIVTILLAASIFFCIPNKARAESKYLGVPVDLYAHFGVAYALQTVAYGIAKKDLHLNKEDSLIISGLIVFAGGVFWGTIISGKYDTNHVLANSLGQAASIGTVLHFDF